LIVLIRVEEGKMEDLIEAIRVRDANCGELILYEYQQFVPHLTALGLDRGAGHRRFVLDTGEIVRRVDEDSFVIVATGELLARIA
jgi:hypothetical protein